jgi:hypothetical protein
MTKLHETPVLGEVPGGGHVLISRPSGIDPEKFTFARVPVASIDGDLDLSHALLDDLAGDGGGGSVLPALLLTNNVVADGSTPCWAALNALFASLPASTGGRIHFTPGNYVVEAPLAWGGKRIQVTADEGAVILAAHNGIILDIVQTDVLKHTIVAGLELRASPGFTPTCGLRISYPHVASYGDQTARVQGVHVMSSSATPVPAGNTGCVLGGVWLVGGWATEVSECAYMGPPTATPVAGTFGLRVAQCYNTHVTGHSVIYADHCVEQADYCEAVWCHQPSWLGNYGYFVVTIPAGNQVNGYSGLQVRISGGEIDCWTGGIYLDQISDGSLTELHVKIRGTGTLSGIELHDCFGIEAYSNHVNGPSGGGTIGVRVSQALGKSNINLIHHNRFSLVATCIQFDLGTLLNQAWDNVGLQAPGTYLQTYVDNGGGVPTQRNFMSWISGPGGVATVNTRVFSGSAGQSLVAIGDVAGATNIISLRAAATGNGVTYGAAGSDTNINVQLVPQGTGKVVVGGSGGFQVNSAGLGVFSTPPPLVRARPSRAAGAVPRRRSWLRCSPR